VFVVLDQDRKLLDEDRFAYQRSGSEFDCKISSTTEILRIREKVLKYSPSRVFLPEFSLGPLEVKLVLRGSLDKNAQQSHVDIPIVYVDGAIPQQIALLDKT